MLIFVTTSINDNCHLLTAIFLIFSYLFWHHFIKSKNLSQIDLSEISITSFYEYAKRRIDLLSSNPAFFQDDRFKDVKRIDPFDITSIITILNYSSSDLTDEIRLRYQLFENYQKNLILFRNDTIPYDYEAWDVNKTPPLIMSPAKYLDNYDQCYNLLNRGHWDFQPDINERLKFDPVMAQFSKLIRFNPNQTKNIDFFSNPLLSWSGGNTQIDRNLIFSDPFSNKLRECLTEKFSSIHVYGDSRARQLYVALMQILVNKKYYMEDGYWNKFYEHSSDGEVDLSYFRVTHFGKNNKFFNFVENRELMRFWGSDLKLNDSKSHLKANLIESEVLPKLIIIPAIILHYTAKTEDFPNWNENR